MILVEKQLKNAVILENSAAFALHKKQKNERKFIYKPSICKTYDSSADLQWQTNATKCSDLNINRRMENHMRLLVFIIQAGRGFYQSCSGSAP